MIYDVKHLLPLNQIVATKTQKCSVVGHHTAGSSDPIATIEGWNADPQRVAAHAVIGGIGRTGDTKNDGVIVQAIDSDYYAFHLGIKGSDDPLHKPKGWYDQRTLGIELCNYGPLTFHGGKYWTYVNSEIPASQVIDLGAGNEFRGYRYYHAYTDKQIHSFCRLIAYYSRICRFKLEPRVFTLADFSYGVAKAAKQAVAFHVNYRDVGEKQDLSPQPKLIAALNALHANPAQFT